MADSNTFFAEVVQNIFNRWTSLRLAVEHGMGGFNGHQKAIGFMDEVTNYCLQMSTPDRGDLNDLLETVLDEEFDTICQDNSTQEVSFFLIKYLRMLRENRLAEIETELSQLPALKERWLTVGHQVNYVAVADESSEEDENEEVVLENGIRISELESEIAPSTSGSTMEVMEEEAEPGWTTIKSKNRRK